MRQSEALKIVDAMKTLYPVLSNELEQIREAVVKSEATGYILRESGLTECPGCHHAISRYAKGHGKHEVNYCKWCGQHINWANQFGEEEEEFPNSNCDYAEQDHVCCGSCELCEYTGATEAKDDVSEFPFEQITAVDEETDESEEDDSTAEEAEDEILLGIDCHPDGYVPF